MGLAFLFLLPLFLGRLIKGAGRVWSAGSGALSMPRLDPLTLFYSTTLALGLASGTMLLQDSYMRWWGDFTVATEAAILAALPLFFRFMADTPKGALRSLSFCFLGLHYWAGLLYLVIFVIGDEKVFSPWR